MSNPPKPDPNGHLSPLSIPAVRRPRSPSPSPVADEDEDDRSEKKTPKRHSFYKAMKFMHRSNSSEAEDATRSGKPSDGRRKTWKVKISSHSAPPEYEERYIRTREVCIHTNEALCFRTDSSNSVSTMSSKRFLGMELMSHVTCLKSVQVSFNSHLLPDLVRLQRH